MIAFFLVIAIVLLLINSLIKKSNFVIINIALSIVLPITIYLLNITRISIDTRNSYGGINGTSDMSFYIGYITVLVELLLLLILFIYKEKEDSFKKICFLGILGIFISILLNVQLWYWGSFSGTIIGLTYDEIYDELKDIIFLSMIMSVIGINSFSLLTFRNKNNQLEEEIKEESKE